MQGLININSRQRIILVSNMPESEVVNGVTYNIKTLSEAHSNAVFFTEKQIHKGENIGNNIWKGGVNFTRVHGVDPEQCSVTIGDELITLNFDPETGLISLITGTNIETVRFLGLMNFINDDEIDTNNLNPNIYSSLYSVGQGKVIFASPTNKVAIYLQLEPKKKNNQTELPGSYSENTVTLPNVIFNSVGGYIDENKSDARVSMLSPDSNEIQLLEARARQNNISNLVNRLLPVYRYELNIVKSTTVNGVTDDLIAYPRACKETDKPKLECFNTPVETLSQTVVRHVLGTSNTWTREFKFTPVNYNLAMYHTQAYIDDANKATTLNVDLIRNNNVTVKVGYDINKNDLSGQYLKEVNTSGNGSLIDIKIYDSHGSDITSAILNNTQYVVFNNSNGEYQLTFKQGFTNSQNGYSVIYIRAIPKTFTGSEANFIGANNNFKYSASLSNFKALTLEFRENENKVYAGVNPYFMGNSYINLNDTANLTEQNIEEYLFNNDNIQSFTCGATDEMCNILNNSGNTSDIRYTLQGFDTVTANNYRNLFIVLPKDWASRMFITEIREDDQLATTNSSTVTVYLKATTTIKEVGKYAIVKTDGYVVDPAKVLILPASQWHEITV